jgi:hypothetical protein
MADELAEIRRAIEQTNARLDRIERRGWLVPVAACASLGGLVLGGVVVGLVLGLGRAGRSAPAPSDSAAAIVMAPAPTPQTPEPCAPATVSALEPTASAPAKKQPIAPARAPTAPRETFTGRPPGCPPEDWDPFERKCRRN